MGHPGNGKSKPLNVLLAYLPVVLALLIMLPRLASPTFGLFDDGKSMLTAQRLAAGDSSFQFDSTDARFRPLYWLSFALLYNVFGGTPFIFYFVNMLALCAATALLVAFLRRAGAGNFQAGLAGLVFVLSGPIIENYYTLSKGEWLQVLFLSLSLWMLTYFQAGSKFWRKALLVFGVSAVLVCAAMSKETSIIILPVSAAWYVLGLLGSRRKKPRAVGWRGAYFFSSSLAVGGYFLLRSIYINQVLSAQGYTKNYSFTLAQISASMIRWAGWLVRDFFWVLPLVGLVIFFIVFRRKLIVRTLLLEAFVWMGAWICVYLPWTYMQEYYMLPFALGLAVFVSACAIEIAPALTQAGWKKWLTMGIAGFSIFLLVGTLLNNLTNARLQLAVDSANASMLNYLVQNAAPDGSVYVNIQDPNEYFDQIQMQLGLVGGRPDLKVIPFAPNLDLTGQTGALYVISPFLENQPLLTVRMGVIESTQKTWDRSLDDYLLSQPGSRVVFESAGKFRLTDINYPRLFCSLIKTRSFCAMQVPFFDFRNFNYGWQVFRVN